MQVLHAVSPGVKKLSIVIGIIAAILLGDLFTRQYNAERVTLHNLCVYQFANNCQCAPADTACLKQCSELRETNGTKCVEETSPTFHKLQDDYTWRLIVWLPAVYGLAMLLIRTMAWLYARYIKTGS